MRTRPQAQISTGTAMEILKLGSLVDAYRTDRNGVDFFFFCPPSPSLDSPPGNALEATLHMTEETLLAQVERQYFFPTSRQLMP